MSQILVAVADLALQFVSEKARVRRQIRRINAQTKRSKGRNPE